MVSIYTFSAILFGLLLDVETPVLVPVAVATPFDHLITGIKLQFPLLVTSVFSDTTNRWAIVHQAGMSMSSPLGTPVHNPRMIIQTSRVFPSEITYKFEVHFVQLSSGSISEGKFHELLQTLLPRSGYSLCPGLPETVVSRLDFESKATRRWGYPFKRVDHMDCKLWFQPEVDASRVPRGPSCVKCCNLAYYLKQRIRKRAAVTPEQKAKRIDPSSKCPIRCLSPASQRKRMRRARMRK